MRARDAAQRVLRALAIVLLGALPAVIVSAQTTHRGQLALTFVVQDRGVAGVEVSRWALEIELAIRRDGRARLAVRGTLGTTSVMAPPDGPRPSRAHHLDIDQVHEGRVIERDARSFTIALDGHGPWRCERDGDAWRCALTTPHRGFPWTDPAPQYLRAPLVVSRAGDVRADVNGSHDRPASVHVTRRR